MSAQHLWVAPGEVETDITGYVKEPNPGEDGFQLQSNAEQGSAGQATVKFDDPDGTFYVTGRNAYRVLETLSEADDPYIFAGAFTEREEERGPYRTGASRIVNANVVDINEGLSKYVIREDEDGDRPQETVSDRMDWLLTTSAMDFLSTAGPIITTYIDADSTLVPAGNLVDYTPQQILDEFAQQSGRNYYLFWDGVELEEFLVYKFDSDDHLTSDLRFSNVESDIDDETTFFLGLDVRQRIDPARIASNITVRHANGRVNENDAATAAEFSRIDKVVDAPLVKTDAIAEQQALRMLGQLDEEERIILGTVYLPARKASQFRAGMRVEMKATHLTGMTEYVWVRLLNVTIVQLSVDPTLSYAFSFEGSIAPPAASCAAILGGITAQVSGNLVGGPAGLGVSVTGATTGDLVIAYVGLNNNSTFLAGDYPISATGSGWTSGESRPLTPGGTHTLSCWAWKMDSGGNPTWDWDGSVPPTGPGNAAEDGRQIGLIIPGGTVVQEASAIGPSGVPTWPSPLTPGNLCLLFGTAEGPSAWNTDPDPSGQWTKLAEVTDAFANPDSNIWVWGICITADNADDLGSAEAGSSWWAHMVEVSL